LIVDSFVVTDFFVLLQEPRRPWLDADALKQKFHVLSAEAHPDRIHSADDSQKAAMARRFAELNAAYHCLLEPKSRVLHLLELERGTRPKEIQQIPGGLADLFAEIATTCKDADAFLAEKKTTTSPLLQVRLFGQAQEWIEKLNVLKNRLGDLQEHLNRELKSLDDAWNDGDGAADRHDLLPRLEELYRLFGYFNRWNSQIQERTVQMML
jgi:DnaJ-domain-containing protein 1